MDHTIENIRKRMNLLAELTGRPLVLGKRTPGDGWTRYTIEGTRGQHPFGEVYYTKKEIYRALGLALQVLDSERAS
jgi:hypothetical protein